MESDLENTQPPQKPRGWVATLGRDVNLALAEIPLLASCFVSGVCESITLTAASVFCQHANRCVTFTLFSHLAPNLTPQTGNTLLYLALGAAQIPADKPLLWLRCLASMSSFLAGCLLFSHGPRLLGSAPQTLTLIILAPPRENPKRDRRVRCRAAAGCGRAHGRVFAEIGSGYGCRAVGCAAVKMGIAVAWLAWEVKEDEKR